jgi:predicted DNA binding CopG/RHH family protein
MQLNKPMGIRLTQEDEYKLRQRANDKGIQVSSYVRVVLKQHLKEENEK